MPHNEQGPEDPFADLNGRIEAARFAVEGVLDDPFAGLDDAIAAAEGRAEIDPFANLDHRIATAQSEVEGAPVDPLADLAERVAVRRSGAEPASGRLANVKARIEARRAQNGL